MPKENFIVLDTGGCNIKIGFSGKDEPERIFPNCVAKFKNDLHSVTGDMLCESAQILSLSLRRPFDKGYIVNFRLQKEIWNRAFFNILKIKPSDYNLIATEPVFNFPDLQKEMKIIFLEHFGFKNVTIKNVAELAIIADSFENPSKRSSQAKTAVIVDIGFSFTHVYPVFDGKVIFDSVKRIDFGGKSMTNLFKEVISFRSLHVLDQPYLMDKVKEDVCFVSQNFKEDLEKSKAKGWKSPFKCECVMPDGIIKDYTLYYEPISKSSNNDRLSEQVISINNERFSIPEILFNPSDIGLNQCGLSETIEQTVSSTPLYLHQLLYENVILIGGVSKCKGLKTRLEKDLRSLIPDSMILNIYLPKKPDIFSWQGGSYLGKIIKERKNI